MTGLSRSSLYTRISEGQFPHQISLGGKAVGWIEREVEAWLNARIEARPGSLNENPVNPVEESGSRSTVEDGETWIREDRGKTTRAISAQPLPFDPGQLHLMASQIYFHAESASFWLKLLPDIHIDHKRRARVANQRYTNSLPGTKERARHCASTRGASRSPRS
jgi:prophage regulatory protein